jgi:tripartite-type tricarboxylate transporter receptor subunit TctC
MRVLSFGLLGLALAIAPCHLAVAQDWPNRPVTMVVPFPAGAAVDTLARAVAQALSEDFGKQFIVENRAGAGGNLGGTAVAKAAADGHTWLFGTPAPIALNKFMYKGLAYDSERDFMPVVLVAKSPLIIAATTDFPAKTLPELIAYAKQNPGKVNVGHPGNGTLGHITSALIQQFAGVEMTHVPYRGSAPLITDLLGGQVNVAMDFMPTYLQLVAEPQDPRAGGDDEPARRATARCADGAGSGFQGIRGDGVVRDRSSHRNAARHREQGEQCGERLPEGATRARPCSSKTRCKGVGGSPEDLKAFIDGERAKWRPVIEAARSRCEAAR